MQDVFKTSSKTKIVTQKTCWRPRNICWDRVKSCDYSDVYNLVTGDIAVTGGNAITKVAFKNYAPFEKCSIEINGALVDEVDFINITMPMYYLIDCSDNYSDAPGNLWQFKRDEIDTNANVCNANSSSFK